MTTPRDIIAYTVTSQADADAADIRLARMGIRGGWRAPLPTDDQAPLWSYCGYDYQQQEWVTFGRQPG